MLTERYDRALVWASELHREQRRKGRGAPYVSHLLAVSSLVLEAGGDEDEAIAALLHDAVEDQGGAPVLREIEVRFGGRVARIVAGCTDTDRTPKPPWRERKEAYIRAVAAADASVRLVVAADKLHNASTTAEDLRAEGPQAWERFRGRERALWFYRSVLEALQNREPPPLVDRLRRVVADLESL